MRNPFLFLPCVLAAPLGAQILNPGPFGAAREVERLAPAELANGDAFGRALVIEGDMLFIGAESHTLQSSGQGAVYVFERDGAGTWTESTRIDPPTDQGSNYLSRFGSALAVEGDLLAVGWPGKNQQKGGVVLFERDAGDPTLWNERKAILGTTPSGWMGQSVALKGDLLLVGAPDACFNTLSGCAPAEQSHVFRRNAGGPDNWGEVAVLPSPGGQCDGFGATVAVGSGFFLVGAPVWDVYCNPSPPSAVHFYALEGGVSGGPTGQLLPFPATGYFRYGQSLALSDTLLAIGFHRGPYGAVSLLEVEGTTLRPLIELAGDPSPQPGYGRSVAVGRDVLAVGEAYSSGNALGTTAGRVWVYARHQRGAQAWGQVTVLESSDARAGDRFGEALAIEGRTLVVGATERDVRPGYVGDPGAVYVFELPLLDRPARRASAISR